ncbi:haloacid dehalogenase [Arthrobacter livingstonensis]|uniref:Haloacid dehalogenase n=1 Tax=Arthrobacter livingstonensis TaxID=670078 RepID=A0A2V5LBB1_9MICC|nr:HAD-IA family hydrolase [Arthrobacter livingstonensis]PYI68931.1 haloacid dehalogenase [Arthrobacter livingstonensis]
MQAITFDLFSALTDARTGGAEMFGIWARQRSWPVTGRQVYDAWDQFNKSAQAEVVGWVSYATLAQQALKSTYLKLDLCGNVATDTSTLLDSQANWPLWPDTESGIKRISARKRVGILSNVDDTLAVRTRAAALFSPDLMLTSQRLGAYKPDPKIYERAKEACGGDLLHVATSARDVRGALEAGIEVVRLLRPGHHLDPNGPKPSQEVASLLELADALGC